MIDELVEVPGETLTVVATEIDRTAGVQYGKTRMATGGMNVVTMIGIGIADADDQAIKER